MSLIVFAPVVILLLGIFYGIYSVAHDIFDYIYNHSRQFIKRKMMLAPKHELILSKYSAYYNLLSETDKARFRKRVQSFMYSKTFVPRVFKAVTDEMKVLISASAVQLTFGLSPIYLAYFDRILIYPDSYYSRITRMYHVGEVNPRMGVIVLSWKAFVDGYADMRDSFNVGIHEMAHAIHFENRIRNEEYDFLNRRALYELEQITARELPKLKAGEPHFLRSYAGTNEYEFFAVSLEYFFEQPIGFTKAMPDLYLTLVRLLNQDPAKLYKNNTVQDGGENSQSN
ncbi:zinc-dependent peptidase [Fulvivirga maritima]|uniref:zinc-dependent peptidase n=1 Tax=Fulvivirga maritima TaxID=2904247 RepID=UPI001F1DA724|nr:zinc-dependent peptidase [Fulvivirga maritima]UII28528.1 zinc-dependent peptidase [Fulvivirga maritima]